MQFQPVPLSAVADNPTGNESVRVTIPPVEVAPMFETVRVYVAPVCP